MSANKKSRHEAENELEPVEYSQERINFNNENCNPQFSSNYNLHNTEDMIPMDLCIKRRVEPSFVEKHIKIESPMDSYNINSLSAPTYNSYNFSRLNENYIQTQTTQSFYKNEEDFVNYLLNNPDETLTFNFNTQADSRVHLTEIIREPSLIPLSILELYRNNSNSSTDFSFIYTLSAQMCQEYIPMDCFPNLKIGLLLSLASIEGDPNRIPLPVIAIGPDTSSANILMNQIGNIAKRFLTAIDDFQSLSIYKENMIEASPVLLAKGGVFYLGDWSRLKPSYAKTILDLLESGTIITDKIHITYPVQCAIWSYFSVYHIRHQKQDMSTLNSFLKVFGMPFIIEEPPESFIDFILTSCCVSSAHQTNNHNKIFIEPSDMKEYILLISQKKVDITPEASDILQKYFVVSRLDRPGCLTKQSYLGLKQIAESFAKLSLRHEVLPSDTISAIYLCEHFLMNIFGPGTCPPPMKSFNLNYLNTDIDVYMKEFTCWLRKYLRRFSNE